MRLVVALASILAGGCVLVAAASKPAIVSRDVTPPLATVKTRCFARTVRATGHVVPRAKAVVTWSEPGFKVEAVAVQAGDRIENGAAVFTVLPPAQAASDLPQAAAAPVTVRTAVAGTVLEAATTVGMLTSARAPLATLAMDGEVEVEAEIAAVHALDLKPGQIAQISIRGGAPFQGYVRALPAEIDARSRVGRVRISVDADHAPEIGREVDVAVEIARSCATAVPLSAVLQDGGGARLMVVKAGAIETRSVHIGFLDSTDIEVSEGVAEGETVVADADELAPDASQRPWSSRRPDGD